MHTEKSSVFIDATGRPYLAQASSDGYFIGVDSAGQPYVSHAFWNRKKDQINGDKKNHKYIEKITVGKKTRYFYSREELEAYYRSLRDKAGQTAKNAVNKVADVVKDKAGVDERERRDEAQRKYESAKRSSARMEKRADELSRQNNNETDKGKKAELSDRERQLRYQKNETMREAKEDLDKAESDYNKTLLGMTERMQDEFGGKAAGKKYQKALDDYKMDPSYENFNNLEKTYERYEKTKDAKERTDEILSPEKTREKVLDDTIKDIDRTIKSTEAFLDKYENEYESLDDDDVQERAFVAKEYLRKLNAHKDYLERDRDGEYSRTRSNMFSDIKKETGDIEREINNMRINNSKDLEAYKKMVKSVFTKDGLVNTLSNAGRDFRNIVGNLEKSEVKYNSITALKEPRSEEEIIRRLSGGDQTNGSCASLAFAYAANKAGYDVRDFRGGDSQKFFSKTDNVMDIAKMSGGNNTVTYSDANNILHDTQQVISNLEPNKEYYLAAGQHAAIIRKTSSGTEYLELQSPNADENGWRELTDGALLFRFGCPFGIPGKKSSSKVQYPLVTIDVDSMVNNPEFLSLMGYINTPINNQRKGRNGSVK